LLKDEAAEARQRLKPDSVELGSFLAETGLHLMNLNAHTEAEPFLRQSVAIRVEVEPNAWTTFATKALLGGSLLRQKKYADAEPLLKGGYEGMKQREASVPVTNLVVQTDTLGWLVQLYDEWDKKEQADEWRKELEAHKKKLTGDGK